jgi:16S rRNA (cytosine1402-N4)-methyltransferase
LKTPCRTFVSANHSFGVNSGAAAFGLRGPARRQRAHALVHGVPAAATDKPPHVPVLLKEALQALQVGRGEVFVDATFGAGGYSRALLEADDTVRVLAVDRDPDAVAAGAALERRFPGRLRLVTGRFGDVAAIVREAFALENNGYVDGVVLDIGVSSMQLDTAARGFSFLHNGPLDMRMEQSGVSAAEIVNTAAEETLADIFHFYGEEKRARAMARAIVEDRAAKPFVTTADLAALAERVIRREPGIHPATRVFQALRIAVNNELAQLSAALHGAEEVLRPGGRLVVVTFHSLEDRIVKQFLLERSGRGAAASRHVPQANPPAPSFELIERKVVTADAAEVALNPRSRSAKLRRARRTSAPPFPVSSAFSVAIPLAASRPRAGKRRGAS